LFCGEQRCAADIGDAYKGPPRAASHFRLSLRKISAYVNGGRLALALAHPIVSAATRPMYIYPTRQPVSARAPRRHKSCESNGGKTRARDRTREGKRSGARGIKHTQPVDRVVYFLYMAMHTYIEREMQPTIALALSHSFRLSLFLRSIFSVPSILFGPVSLSSTPFYFSLSFRSRCSLFFIPRFFLRSIALSSLSFCTP